MEKTIKITGENIQISDGYHTFDQLYEHRIALFIALCKTLSSFKQPVGIWRSTVHSDETSFDGWFILGINFLAGEQITYHLPLSKWEETEFARTVDKAPEYDGHTSDDVLKRLKNI